MLECDSGRLDLEHGLETDLLHQIASSFPLVTSQALIALAPLLSFFELVHLVSTTCGLLLSDNHKFLLDRIASGLFANL